MVVAYYSVVFIATAIVSFLYAIKWNKNYDLHLSCIFLIIPISTLGYLLFALSSNFSTAIICNQLEYLGGIFLPILVILLVFEICKIRVKKVFVGILFGFGFFLFAAVLSVGHSPIYYKDFFIYIANDVTYAVKENGPVHLVFQIYLAAVALTSLFILIRTRRTKHNVSRLNLTILIVGEIFVIAIYFITSFISLPIDLIPAAYVVVQINLLIISNRISLYSLDDVIMENVRRTEYTGYFGLDLKHTYLGANKIAEKVFPELEAHTVDTKFPCQTDFEKMVMGWVDDVDHYKGTMEFKYSPDEEMDLSEESKTFYRIKASYIYDGNIIRGYQFVISDVTENQRYINLLNNYRESLEKEVAQQTKYLQDSHDTLILSLASMVENRDASTGGHIRRTSEVVKILVEEMQKDKDRPEMTPLFCHNVAKAAPMHDLGKIAVEDRILKKPGVFTKEEYEEMKSHAAKGGIIVQQILSGTRDSYFLKIAENVAHYHHERWDGSGYPEGLKGTEIPLEARIMAVADVYDALVSQRCYKESLSYQEAFDYIEAGMGTQFDPDLNKYFVAIRPFLESYYSSVAAQEKMND